MKIFFGTVLIIALFLLFTLPHKALSQVKSEQNSTIVSKTDSNGHEFKFIPVPYIDYNRSLGFSLGAVPLAMYYLSKKDTISPSSISGGVGFYSTTQSWFVVQFNQWYINQDNYRVKLAGGTGNINFQFFLDHPISPGYIDYNTTADFLAVELQRRVYKKLYLGLNYTFSKVKTQFDINNNPTQEDNFHSIGGVASLDTRDNVYYPHKGFISDVKYLSYPESLGNKHVSQKIEVDYNLFFKAKNKRDIWASRIYGGFGIGDLNFNQQFVVGRTDIRGYTLGKYRGDQIIAIQSEYRMNPFKKLGFVGFGGLATVFGAINESDNGQILPGVGVGVRYVVFEKNHMNMGMDVAMGKGDWGFYFKIGESF
ncbi:MAG: BamA/TamA family outer membrane protein [Salibacteraceae bacterium]